VHVAKTNTISLKIKGHVDRPGWRKFLKNPCSRASARQGLEVSEQEDSGESKKGKISKAASTAGRRSLPRSLCAYIYIYIWFPAGRLVWPIHRSADDDDKVAGSVVCLINWLCPQSQEHHRERMMMMERRKLTVAETTWYVREAPRVCVAPAAVS
jgi:hypothetical protein